MIRLHNIRVNIAPRIDLIKVVANKLKVNIEDIKEVTIHKMAIDARNKLHFAYVYDLDVQIDNENKYLEKNITLVKDENYIEPTIGNTCLNRPPVIVGSGPAGLFCAYKLAKRGYNPIIIERGECIEERVKRVEALFNENILNENSNVQFGEGGAGTFSDGKLNTLTKDYCFRMKEVFKIFVECGAPEEIMYLSKPHIGTDKLREVIVNMRNKIISYGGTFKYNSLMSDIVIDNNYITGIIVNNKLIKTDVLVLAIGHSARDTFYMMNEKGISMTSKPFAIGVRIVHSQDLINENQYPINYPYLPPSSYKLTYTTKKKRGVYSFCMCPGGYVVNSRSTKNGIVVNGMSNYNRNSGFANSAIVVTTNELDYGTSLFGGLELQEKIEEKAFKLGKGKIPMQRYIDYKNGQITKDIPEIPVKGQVSLADINDIMPCYINEALKEGIDYFGTKIKGFNTEDAYILAPETRTSSPIRIIRNEALESNIKGIYPCGEGSGYSGGITTSAIDGIKVYEQIVSKYCKNYK